MEIYIDTANIDEIRELADYGIIDGVTTNPSLMAKNNTNSGDVKKIFKEICEIMGNCPVSAEVNALDAENMIREGKILSEIAENIVVKLPVTMEGLKACHALARDEIMVNMTLCFSPSQALMAARAGATFISPFVGRLDDCSQSGIDLVKDICNIYERHMLETSVLAASIRHPHHFVEVAKAGADIATIPYALIKQLIKHPLTDRGLEIFEKDGKDQVI